MGGAALTMSVCCLELAKTTNEVARKNLKTHRKHDEGWQEEAIFSGYQEMEVTAAGLQWSLQLIICYRTASSQSSNEILVLIRDHQLDTHKKNLELLLPPLPANLCVFFFLLFTTTTHSSGFHNTPSSNTKV
jgi:hypothetical protein